MTEETFTVTRSRRCNRCGILIISIYDAREDTIQIKASSLCETMEECVAEIAPRFPEFMVRQ